MSPPPSNALLLLSALLLSLVMTTCLPRPCDSASLITPQERRAVDEIIANLSVSEMVQNLLTGSADVRGYTGYIPGVRRLGIPPLTMNDGPQGFRNLFGGKTSTAWPCALSLASTWSSSLVEEVAEAIAEEFRMKGANVFLGPGVNINRIPYNGRNFEYLSGEDARLGEVLVSAFVRGLQRGGHVMATAKHYVNNNQETNRGTMSAVVDDETQFNLYYRPFRAAVEAGALAFMCSYNKINDVPGCSNSATLQSALKREFGFEGLVMSDWFATRDTVQSALNGLDVEMPIGVYYGYALEGAVRRGAVPRSAIEEKARRVLTAMVAAKELVVLKKDSLSGDLSSPRVDATPKVDRNVTSAKHSRLARRVVCESTVLLRNEGEALPIPARKSITILVLGDRAQDRPIAVGGGSGHVAPPYIITPLQGIRAVLREMTLSTHETDVDESEHEDDDGVRYASTSEFLALARRGKASEALAKADYVVACVGTTSNEGVDRASLSLDDDDQALLLALVGAGENLHARRPKLVVSVIAPGPTILSPWDVKVDAVVFQFLPGQESGLGLADVLLGSCAPGGRLPISLPNRENEQNMTVAQYPGLKSGTETHYLEGLRVGYRWYMARAMEGEHVVRPRYPFGFGLEYSRRRSHHFTTAEESDDNGDDARVAVELIKTREDDDGPSLSLSIVARRLEAVEVLQLYALSTPVPLSRRPPFLAGFWKLRGGRLDLSRLVLPLASLEWWDLATRRWSVVPGEYEFALASDSSLKHAVKFKCHLRFLDENWRVELVAVEGNEVAGVHHSHLEMKMCGGALVVFFICTWWVRRKNAARHSALDSSSNGEEPLLLTKS